MDRFQRAGDCMINRAHGVVRRLMIHHHSGCRKLGSRRGLPPALKRAQSHPIRSAASPPEPGTAAAFSGDGVNPPDLPWMGDRRNFKLSAVALSRQDRRHRLMLLDYRPTHVNLTSQAVEVFTFVPLQNIHVNHDQVAHGPNDPLMIESNSCAASPCTKASGRLNRRWGYDFDGGSCQNCVDISGDSQAGEGRSNLFRRSPLTNRDQPSIGTVSQQAALHPAPTSVVKPAHRLLGWIAPTGPRAMQIGPGPNRVAPRQGSTKRDWGHRGPEPGLWRIDDGRGWDLEPRAGYSRLALPAGRAADGTCQTSGA